MFFLVPHTKFHRSVICLNWFAFLTHYTICSVTVMLKQCIVAEWAKAGLQRQERTDRVKLIGPQNQGSKQLWYRWQSLAGELLWKSLIESSCQGGWSNQRACVFQVKRGHVESIINPTSWSSTQRKRLSVGVLSSLWRIVHPSAFMCNS